MTKYNKIQHSTTQYTIQHNTIKHNTSQYSRIQQIQQNTTPYKTIQIQTTQPNTTQYKIKQHNTTQLNTIQYYKIQYVHHNMPTTSKLRRNTTQSYTIYLQHIDIFASAADWLRLQSILNKAIINISLVITHALH